MPNYKQCQNNKWSIYPSGQCNGGQAFEVRGKMFCSPSCSNEYWGLKKSDDDWWPEARLPSEYDEIWLNESDEE